MRYRCELITLLHIGTGQTLIPLEYLADGSFAVVNQEPLFRSAPALAEDLAQRLRNLTPDDVQRQSLAQFLPASLRDRGDLHRYRCALSAYVRAQLDRARERGQAEVRVAIKTTDERPYLPGTSLKGALRTALAYAWLKEDPAALAALKGPGTPVREKWKMVEGLLRAGGENDVTRDVLRALEVGDSAPLKAEDWLLVAHEAVLSAPVRSGANAPGDAHASWKGFPTFLEAINTNAVLEGRIGLHERLLSPRVGERLGWKPRHQRLSLAEILRAANVLAADVIAWEQRYLSRVTGVDADAVRRFYQELSTKVRTVSGNEAYICLGRGAGWHKSTVGLLLEQAEGFDFAAFRRQGGTSERRGAGFDRTDFEFPKTRKFIMEAPGKPKAPLGWVRLVLPGLPPECRARPVRGAEAAAAPPRTRDSDGLPRRKGAAEGHGPTRPSTESKTDLDALRRRLAKPERRGSQTEATTKAAEKAKREQEKIARRYRGEEG